MPSTHQSGDRTDYDDDTKRMVAEKPDQVLGAIVKGIRTKERAREYIEAEVAVAEDEGRDPRGDLIGMLNAKVQLAKDDPK